ncbi:MAG: hypothetical protein IJA21_02490 [Clostridia bacterium]|nr:hypothetical protein [Clostridia bacterium]
MNFEITNKLIDTIKPYLENAKITISTANKDWKGRKYKSDFVTIDEKNNVGFEVFENEIIMFYFTDHYHFEDYSSELVDGGDDYVKRAKVFIIELFENKIKYIQVYKGKKLATEKYYIVYSDNTEERIGGTWWGLARILNPFAKRAEKTTIYKFNKEKGFFE